SGAACLFCSFCTGLAALSEVCGTSDRKLDAICAALPHSKLQHLPSHAGKYIQLPASCAAVPGHRQLSRRRVVFSRLLNEEVCVSEEAELDHEFCSFCC